MQVQLCAARAACMVADTKKPLPRLDPVLKLSGENSVFNSHPHGWHRGTNRFGSVVLRNTELKALCFFSSFSSGMHHGNEQKTSEILMQSLVIPHVQWHSVTEELEWPGVLVPACEEDMH